MKRAAPAIAAIVLLLGFAAAWAAPVAAPPPDPRALTYAPLSIAFPKPEKILLPNGLLVYLFEDHELPLIDAAIDFKAGGVFDPPAKPGLASLAATLMRGGGTEQQTPDQVDDALEFMPAQVSLGAADDMLSGSVSAVKDRFPEALRIFAAMLRAPRFDSSRLEVEKARAIEDIDRKSVV